MKHRFSRELTNLWDRVRFRAQSSIFDKYRSRSMIGRRAYCANLELVTNTSAMLPMNELSIVECGTWRGGMSLGMLEAVPDCRAFHMFDSFEGLPVPGDRDGQKVQDMFEAKRFVAERNYASYEDVCSALTKYGFWDRVQVHKGWFKDTVTPDAVQKDIAILRLDGDWYDSTILVLEKLFDRVVPGGIVIVDDYYSWPGCSQAVHEFLADRKAPEVIKVWRNIVPYIVKLPDDYLLGSIGKN
ncbi:hypothetical protein HKCCE3408_14520 [Rhodobacterales bacterium HKCCE3408]|nr:hypothetical protein [Rhodobacterales bacterium HKCCE3408]